MKAMKRRLGILLALSLLPAFDVPGAQAPARAKLLQACRIPGLGSDAWCGSVEVFENRAAKRGRKIALHVVVLPATGKKPAPDPVFFFAGGPGQSAASLAPVLAEGPLAKIGETRDLVLLDQRGTGESNPLTCDLYGNDTDLRNYFEDMFPPPKVRACRDRLEKIADLKQYTTTHAIQDLDDVRRALGYDKINLYGGSYGTTVALAYLRQYGSHVRSTVLAGVAPTDLRLPLPFARGAQFALDHLLDDCAAEAACHAAFPRVRAELDAVLERLAQGPASVQMVNPFTQETQRIRLSRGVFGERIRTMLYDRDVASLVPMVIHQAYAGDFRPFVLAVLPQARGISQSVALGMYFSVTCAEDVAFITEEDLKKETGGTFLGDYRVRVHQGACREWPRAVVPPTFIQAVRSDGPVLLLSGEVDPASPHWLAVEVARHLPHGIQVTIPKGGHNYFSPCISEITSAFVARGSVEGLDTACAQRAKRPPFVTTVPGELRGQRRV